MNLGELGVWYPADKLDPRQWIEFVAHVENLGYGTLWHAESELADGGNERFLDAMVVSGTKEEITARVQAHRDAGANHVSIQPVTEEGDFVGAMDMLEALAGG